MGQTQSERPTHLSSRRASNEASMLLVMGVADMDLDPFSRGVAYMRSSAEFGYLSMMI